MEIAWGWVGYATSAVVLCLGVLVVTWSCAAALRLNRFQRFHLLPPARQQMMKPDSSWQRFTEPSPWHNCKWNLTHGYFLFLFPYLFRKESFVPCLTGLQICKGWNPSKGARAAIRQKVNYWTPQQKPRDVTRLKTSTKGIVSAGDGIWQEGCPTARFNVGSEVRVWRRWRAE